jgi:3-hydroxyisobutyrate dehydrogenase-like beta-hydroxyacid dehydrogenase
MKPLRKAIDDQFGAYCSIALQCRGSDVVFTLVTKHNAVFNVVNEQLQTYLSSATNGSSLVRVTLWAGKKPAVSIL